MINDVVIVGAGPAGLMAAIELRKNGLSVTLIDEFPKPGGRLLGQLHEEPNGEWWNGLSEADKLINTAVTLGANIVCGVAVYHLEKTEDHFTVYTNEGNYLANNVIIATGAAESALPIPGWTLPGVMSIGAAQVMTNVHRVKVGERGVIVGINVLSAAIARELQLANIDITCLALPSKNIATKKESNPRQVMERLLHIAHLAPSKLIRFGSKFAKTSPIQNLAINLFPKKGVSMWGMPVHLRKAIKTINGEKQVESVTIVNVTADGLAIKGTEQTVKTDFVCIASGLYPLVELAAVIDCPMIYVEELGGHIPIHNEAMETPIEGIYLAGNITGIESAKVAQAQGTVAGLSVAKKHTISNNIDRQLDSAIEKVKQLRSAATIQFHPAIEAGRTNVQTAFLKYN